MRKRISLALKLEAVLHAEKNSVSATARKFDVDPKQIRDWRKQKSQLEFLIRGGIGPDRLRLCGGGSKIVSSEMEMELYKWIMLKKRADEEVTSAQICTKAKEIFASLENPARQTFRASKGWYEKFMVRNGLNEKDKTVNDVCRKILSHIMSVSQTRQKNSIENGNIIAMDEVSITFDMPPNIPNTHHESLSAEPKSGDEEKKLFDDENDNDNDHNIRIATNVTSEVDRTQTQITVVLAATGDGRKMKPFIVFNDCSNSDTDPSTQLQTMDPLSDVMIVSSPDGWMTLDLTSTWIKEVGTKNAVFPNQPALLVWDSCQCHVCPDMKEILDEQPMMHVAEIPGGCSKYVQASNLFWSKPFKQKVIEYFDEWMEGDDVKDYTIDNVLKAPSVEIVSEWVKCAWDSLDDDMIFESFKSVGLTNALDGSEDNQIICFKEGQPCQLGWQRLQNFRYTFGQENDFMDNINMLMDAENVNEGQQQQSEFINNLDNNTNTPTNHNDMITGFVDSHS